MKLTLILCIALGMVVMATVPVQALPAPRSAAPGGEFEAGPIDCFGLPCNLINAVCYRVAGGQCLG